MPNKMPNCPKNKSSCERIYKSSTPSSSEKQVKCGKSVVQNNSSRTNIKQGKSCSTAIISNNYTKPPIVRPKKTTRSECFSNKSTHLFDYCGNCGDTVHHRVISTKKPPADTNKGQDDRKTNKTIHVISLPKEDIRKKDETKANERAKKAQPSNQILKDGQAPSSSKELGDTTKRAYSKPAIITENVDKDNVTRSRQPVEQYYKNENFQRKSGSSQEIHFLKKRSSLDTIKEVPESTLQDSSTVDSSCIFRVFSDSEEEIVAVSDFDDYDSLKKLREFRDENYFECHSVKSRIRSKVSVTSLPNHKCVYRFYLNDRLFPVPLNYDHNKTIRCTECYLPLDLEKDQSNSTKKINGTIQAKVKIRSSDEAQDLLLMLPIKEPLIIPEKRKTKPTVDEVVYFGVIKLDAYGNSAFNKTLPSDSLALKYQRGYKEFESGGGVEFKYDKMSESDIIVV